MEMCRTAETVSQEPHPLHNKSEKFSQTYSFSLRRGWGSCPTSSIPNFETNTGVMNPKVWLGRRSLFLKGSGTDSLTIGPSTKAAV